MKHLQLSDLNQTELNLLEQAKLAANNFFNKRSNRRVGAALLCSDGSIYQGVSIRRTNVSSSTCAERMALDRAIFDKKYKYQTLVVVGYHDEKHPEEITAPCGLCRQILAEAEFNGDTRQPFAILLVSSDTTNIIKTDTDEIFPISYHGKEK